MKGFIIHCFFKGIIVSRDFWCPILLHWIDINYVIPVGVDQVSFHI
jgi:hypothetical protein